MSTLLPTSKPTAWESAFKASAHDSSFDAIALARRLLSEPTSSAQVNARIFAAAASHCIDLTMEQDAKDFFDAYVASGKASPKQQKLLSEQLGKLPAASLKARLALEKATQGDAGSLDEEDWRYVVRVRAGRALLEPLLTASSTGAFLAVSTLVKSWSTILADMSPEERATYRATPPGSNRVVVFFDGASWVAPPVSFVHEGSWPNEDPIDTTRFIPGEEVQPQGVLRMKKAHHFRHVECFGRSLRFYATYWAGASTGQSIEHRFWLLCEDEAFAQRLFAMAQTSEWIGSKVEVSPNDRRLLVERFYSPKTKETRQLGLLHDIVVDTPDGQNTFDTLRLLDFLKDHYKEHKKPYPVVEECLKGNIALNTKGLTWVRFPPMQRFPSTKDAIEFHQARRLELWRQGFRVWSYDEIPLGRP